VIQILRKKGWKLNPNDKIVNSILRMVEKNNGECACNNDSIDKHCPCTNYKEKDICHCTLYIKEE
jgi:ferredoxin-thioredoxin reductase catalytic subunit